MKRTISIVTTLSLLSCSTINQKLGLEDDNLGEEMVEDVIKGRTGVDIDLTPATPEKK